MKNVIITKIGSFNIEDNGNNGTIITINETKIAEFPKISWWNKDNLINAIEKNEETIKDRIQKRCHNNINRENAIDIMERLIEILGNENKGFYSSRLKQCINKLKTVA